MILMKNSEQSLTAGRIQLNNHRLSRLLAVAMSTSTSAALGWLIFLPVVLMQQDTQTANWSAQIELELREQPDKLAYCRALQQKNLQIVLQNTGCASILNDQLAVTGELLLETQKRCWSGWVLSGRRCRKIA
nr:uncharacterized protein LOC108012125 [Drosophila suzukii]